jgi:hypothetical protein
MRNTRSRGIVLFLAHGSTQNFHFLGAKQKARTPLEFLHYSKRRTCADDANATTYARSANCHRASLMHEFVFNNVVSAFSRRVHPKYT